MTVVKGAMLAGMGIGREAPAKMRLCPKHYGISLHMPYEKWEGERRDTVKHSPINTALVEHEITWLIHKGDVILPETPIMDSYSFLRNISKSQCKPGMVWTIAFVATPLEDAPSNLLDILRRM
jgi:hypothetical protein